MRLEKLSDRLYYFPHAEYADRPTLTYVRGDRVSLCVDAGNSARHVQAFYQALQAEGLPLPGLTALTHWHWDHTFGMHAVSGLTVASRATDDKLRAVRQWAWDDASMRARLASGEEIAFCDECIRQEYVDRSEIRVVPADIAFEGRMTVDLGGATCELFEFDAPHSFGSVLARLSPGGVLVMGDADCGDHYENGGRHDPAKYRALLAFLEACDFEIALLGHDAPRPKETLLAEIRADIESGD